MGYTVAPPAGRGRTGRAVVLGASMAGLLAARVLSDTFDSVVVIERDDLAGTGPRKGVPQGRHAHGILAKGREVLEELFPGLTGDLVDRGGIAIDLHKDVAWYHGTSALSAAPSDLVALSVSRPTMEDYIRGRVRQLANVEFNGGYEATGLLSDAGHGTVTGVRTVRLEDNTGADLAADLVVDATGRGNRGTTWLTQLGYQAPREEAIKAGIVYTTRQYVRDTPTMSSGTTAIVSALAPTFPYSVVVLPIEDDRWIITLMGIGDDVAPADAAGFTEFAHRLPMADLHEIVDEAAPLTEPLHFRIPASVRRRYEGLTRVPEGYVVLGDALCAFNPVYGQGMTVAAVEAMVLRECLRASRHDLPRRFYRQAARFIDIPWDMAAGGDLALPTTVGKRTLKTRLLNAYVAKVLRAAEVDTRVSLAFHRTVNLISRPERLFAPRILGRVLFPRRSAVGHEAKPVAQPVGAR